MLVGTPLFMSPEQMTGNAVDARSDIYSFAAVAFYALVGQHATPDGDLVNVIIDVCEKQPPTVSSLLPDIPKELDQAFAQALAKTPKARPSSADAWAEELADQLDELPSTVDGWEIP